ncbi:MAG: hypothetical protein Q9164_001235 [Protoblastenia rupestris]
MAHDRARTEAQGLDHKAAKRHPFNKLEQEYDPSDAASPLSLLEHTYGIIELEKQDVKALWDELTPPVVRVPLSKRRGLFGRFAVVAEVTEPKHYPRSTKWFITFVVALASMVTPLGSTIIFHKHFEVDLIHFLLTSASYMLAMAIFPLWWSSLSEIFGRRTIYLVSLTMFVFWNILGAVSVNVTMLIAMRMLAGGTASSVQVVGAGTVADIWEVKERGTAMGAFFLGPMMGPLLAPIIGGALAQALGWRSTQWFLAMYGGLLLVFVFFALPETTQNIQGNLVDKPSNPSCMRQKLFRYLCLLRRILIDPLKIILYLRLPPIFLTVFYTSITFSSLYLLNISLSTTFSTTPDNFPPQKVGLTYFPSSLGYILASLLGGRWTDIIMAREARRANRYTTTGTLIYHPEDRMRENA